MLLKRLKLTNFRNIEHFEEDFNTLKIIILGQNAQGKSNILEAVNILAKSSSDRALRDNELINFNKEFALINSDIKTSDDDIEISLQINTTGRRKLKINGVSKKAPQADLIGNFFTVMFAADDLYLIKGSPSLRRKWLDSNLTQLSKIYHNHFATYQKSITQKNALLKSAFESGMSRKSLQEQLSIWNKQIIEYGAEILLQRVDYVNKIESFAKQFLNDMSSGNETLQLNYFSKIFSDTPYVPDVEKIKAMFEDSINNSFDEELARGQALVGPHRDDVLIQINDKEARAFASQGQQRSIILSLKLAELKAVEILKNEVPVLLLDDVFAELDESRQNFLLHNLPEGIQTFITTTHISDLQHDLLENALVLKVEKGKIVKKPVTSGF
ncbi:MAG: DNA replication/repair protein RecF [Candidatus Melainabacteria bacterium]|nr:DNA replication/repair protein RecF [Candidatus Melainabacteria bacterium]